MVGISARRRASRKDNCADCEELDVGDGEGAQARGREVDCRERVMDGEAHRNAMLMLGADKIWVGVEVVRFEQEQCDTERQISEEQRDGHQRNLVQNGFLGFRS